MRPGVIMLEVTVRDILYMQETAAQSVCKVVASVLKASSTYRKTWTATAALQAFLNIGPRCTADMSEYGHIATAARRYF